MNRKLQKKFTPFRIKGRNYLRNYNNILNIHGTNFLRFLTNNNISSNDSVVTNNTLLGEKQENFLDS